MSETYKARFILTESIYATPCISDLLEWADESADAELTVHSISEDDASPRIIDASLELPYDVRNLVEEVVAQYITEESSDVSLEFVEVSV